MLCLVDKSSFYNEKQVASTCSREKHMMNLHPLQYKNTRMWPHRFIICLVLALYIKIIPRVPGIFIFNKDMVNTQVPFYCGGALCTTVQVLCTIDNAICSGITFLASIHLFVFLTFHFIFARYHHSSWWSIQFRQSFSLD